MRKPEPTHWWIPPDDLPPRERARWHEQLHREGFHEDVIAEGCPSCNAQRQRADRFGPN
jgi:hypothetical protein